MVREVSPDELDLVEAVCLDPSVPPKWRVAMKPAMERRKVWLRKMMRKGLQVSVVFSGRKPTTPKGLVEYVPIEYAPEPVVGKKSLFMNCLWVMPPCWRHGYGSSLMRRFLDKAKSCGGATVLAYEGDKWFGFFSYMPTDYFRKFGFKEVGRDGSRVLLHLDLGAHTRPVLVLPKRQASKSDRGCVEVLFNSQCPWSGWMCRRAEEELAKHGVVVDTVGTDRRRVMMKYGLSRGVYVDGNPVVCRMASEREVEAAVKSARRAKVSP
jgi:GNAT superfamily N-acetyltransferase